MAKAQKRITGTFSSTEPFIAQAIITNHNGDVLLVKHEQYRMLSLPFVGLEQTTYENNQRALSVLRDTLHREHGIVFEYDEWIQMSEVMHQKEALPSMQPKQFRAVQAQTFCGSLKKSKDMFHSRNMNEYFWLAFSTPKTGERLRVTGGDTKGYSIEPLAADTIREMFSKDSHCMPREMKW